MTINKIYKVGVKKWRNYNYHIFLMMIKLVHLLCKIFCQSPKKLNLTLILSSRLVIWKIYKTELKNRCSYREYSLPLHRNIIHNNPK